MKALLINTEFCTGCHSCEVACKKERGLAKGEFGIKLMETGPYQYETGDLAGTWEWTWTPIVTKACDMCADRVAKRKMPMCVQHCQAWCMYYGEAEELVGKMDGSSRWVMYTR
jgi:Fe-S-cluster-containing dehydrogenase component